LKIEQKVIKHTPTDKVKDLLINMMAGGHGVADINNRVRVDKTIQLTFGRRVFAEQSTISGTLNACTEKNVLELAGVSITLNQIHKLAQAFQVNWPHFAPNEMCLILGEI
jgi:hypothetical protein